MKSKLFRFFLLILCGVALLVACNSAASSPSPEPQAQMGLSGMSTGFNNAMTGMTQNNQTQQGPPTWTISFTYVEPGGGSVTMVFSISSTSAGFNPWTTAYPGWTGSYSITLAFTNFTDSGYLYNGAINVGGGFTTTTAQNGDVLMNVAYNYTGSLNASGAGNFTYDFNCSMFVTEDLTAYRIVSGPSYTGTVSVNGTPYSLNIAPVTLGKVLFGKSR